MAGILKRDKPLMIIELNEATLVQANGHTPDRELLALLGELGYQVFDAETEQPYQLAAIRQTYACANLLCSPE